MINEYCVSFQKKASRDTRCIPALLVKIIALRQIALFLTLTNIGFNLP